MALFFYIFDFLGAGFSDFSLVTSSPIKKVKGKL